MKPSSHKFTLPKTVWEICMLPTHCLSIYLHSSTCTCTFTCMTALFLTWQCGCCWAWQLWSCTVHKWPAQSRFHSWIAPCLAVLPQHIASASRRDHPTTGNNRAIWQIFTPYFKMLVITVFKQQQLYTCISTNFMGQYTRNRQGLIYM